MRNGCYSASEEPSAYGVCSISCGYNGNNDGIAGFGSERPVELGYPERERNGLRGELRGKRGRNMILTVKYGQLSLKVFFIFYCAFILAFKNIFLP